MTRKEIIIELDEIIKELNELRNKINERNEFEDALTEVEVEKLFEFNEQYNKFMLYLNN